MARREGLWGAASRRAGAMISDRPYIEPPTREQLEGHAIKRCAFDMQLWRADDIRENLDGLELCPNHRDNSATATDQAMRKEIMAGNLHRYVPEPNYGQAPLVYATEPTIVSMEDADGYLVYAGDPLRLVRNVATVLILNGVGFSASDVITYSSGISDSVAPSRTPTVTTLTVIASLAMDLGKYDLIFNGDTFASIFSVR